MAAAVRACQHARTRRERTCSEQHLGALPEAPPPSSPGVLWPAMLSRGAGAESRPTLTHRLSASSAFLACM